MYNKREWFNGAKSPYTGSIVCYDGTTVLGESDGRARRHTFVEIADCRNKVWLHRDANTSKKKFIKKLKLLVLELTAFISYLEKA